MKFLLIVFLCVPIFSQSYEKYQKNCNRCKEDLSDCQKRKSYANSQMRIGPDCQSLNHRCEKLCEQAEIKRQGGQTDDEKAADMYMNDFIERGKFRASLNSHQQQLYQLLSELFINNLDGYYMTCQQRFRMTGDPITDGHMLKGMDFCVIGQFRNWTRRVNPQNFEYIMRSNRIAENDWPIANAIIYNLISELLSQMHHL